MPGPRLYGDLAYLWPLVSDREAYADEAGDWRDILLERLGGGRKKVLDLGSGGGHNLSFLTAEFDAVAVDLSEKMLAHNRALNPAVRTVAADMRHVRLDEKFDAVLLHDAASYLVNENDLNATAATARAHLKKGGIFLAAPDYVKETFAGPLVGHVTRRHGDLELTYVEYVYDPDPSDTAVEAIMTFFIREGSSPLRIETDRHTLGIHAKAAWLRVLKDAGFSAEVLTMPGYDQDRMGTLFVGRVR